MLTGSASCPTIVRATLARRGRTSRTILFTATTLAPLGLTSCGDYGRYPEEIDALKVAADTSKSDEDALVEIAKACAPASVGEPEFDAEQGVLRVLSEPDPDIHAKLIDKHGGKGNAAMNVEGYRRQLSRQVVCMFLAGKDRGLERVRLGQRVHLTLQNEYLHTFEVEIDAQTLGGVEKWDQATFNPETRWKIYDAVSDAWTVETDNSAQLDVVQIAP